MELEFICGRSILFNPALINSTAYRDFSAHRTEPKWHGFIPT